MTDPNIQDIKPRNMAFELSHLFEQAFGQQREIWEQVTRYSRDESLRFTTLRLKRTNQALEDFHGQDGFKNLISAQQAWVRDLVQDYAAQSIRCSEILGGLSTRAMAMAVDAGKEALREGHEALKQGQAAAAENAETVREAGEKVIHANHEAVMDNVESVTPIQPSQEYH